MCKVHNILNKIMGKYKMYLLYNTVSKFTVHQIALVLKKKKTIGMQFEKMSMGGQ